METAPHHAWKKLSALLMTLALMMTLLPAALAVDLNVDAGFYFKQSRGGTCTLASAAMMLRRRAYFDGLDGWVDVTENSIKSTAWAGGLSHSFTYNAMHVGYATLPSGKAAKTEALIRILQEHPEGIVLYDRSQPHAVLLTDYTNGVFYCSDPANGVSAGRVPLSSASISIAGASCYWYITSDANDDGVGLEELEAAVVAEETAAETATETTVVEGGLAAAKAEADKIAAAATNEDTFNAAVNAYKEGATVQTGSNVASSVNELYRDWVTGARTAGDVTVVGDDNGYTVVLYQGVENQQYHEVSVRHILIKAEDTDGDGSYSEEELAAAKAKIDEINAEWEASDKTEETFAALAEKYSEDTGSNTKGGLYEGIYKGQMVQEFNDFCFAAGRKTGDTAIVHGSSSGYDGYHLVYFVGEGNLHSLEMARDSLVSAAYSEWETAALADVTTATKFGYKLIGK